MDEVAVVGLGLRFPGDATSPEDLWKVLERGESQWSEFPKDRLNIDGYFHPSGDRQGSISFRGAHFLKGDVAAFDAPFFSIAAEDAKAIDPQQRMLLEVCYEALENAGLRKEDLDGSNTSVYVGSFVKDYEQICLRDPDWQPRYAATGNGIAIMANRISHFFNFHGPSMTIDTGCSGSLVSVHLAAQSLRSGESSLAIAAGSGMILTPNTIMPMTALNFLSPDGKCFTFDSRANGYGRGEGIGVVVMKRLADALRDKDTIRAIIRGSAVNQDGRTPGITLPSKEAQVSNIRSVYTSAGLDYSQTAYVECHGTGTQAGDWRELKAISETLGSGHLTVNPIVVGSVKPNIGHLEGAAGIAGMIKAVLVLEHGKIPPNINFEKGNPDIDFENWKIKVPTEVMDWPLDGRRRVSVNCFGFGGTNAHVIMDEVPDYLSCLGLSGNHNSLDSVATLLESSSVDGEPLNGSGSHLFCYSSHEKSGILRIMNSHLGFLEAKKDCSQAYLQDYAYTLNCRRSSLEWKGFVVASSLADFASQVQDLDQTSIIRSSREKQPRLGFLFCGQGAQWAQMGKDLMCFENFRTTMEEASSYMSIVLKSPFSLAEELSRNEGDSLLMQPQISQPATTAIQVALVDLLRSLGISPRHVIGHSSGEIAAAYAAGSLTRQTAWEVAYFRGVAAASIALRDPYFQGGMLVVGLSETDAKMYLQSANQPVEIACINSPRSVTLSGDKERIRVVENELRNKQIFCRTLNVTVPYHSSHMKPMESEYGSVLSHIDARTCSKNISMFSTVTGNVIKGVELNAAYWATNMVSPVQYVAAVQAMINLTADKRPDILIELSPRGALRSPTLDILATQPGDSSQPVYHSILDPKSRGVVSFLKVVGELWSRGCPIDMAKIAPRASSSPEPKSLVDLPSYPWNHTKSYWHESHLSLANRFREFGRRDLIGAPTADSVPLEPRWRGFLRVSEVPWVQDHQVQKTIVYPAAGMVSMVLEGAQQMRRDMKDLLGYEISNMQIERAMIIPNTSHGLEIALNIKTLRGGANDISSPDRHEFAIYSKQLDHDWERNATGTLHFRTRSVKWFSLFQSHDEGYESKASMGEYLDARQLYESLDTVGMNYGPLFQNMGMIKKGVNFCTSMVHVPDTHDKMPVGFEYPHLIHPATLDSMFQTLFVIDPSPMVPISIKSIFVSANAYESVGFRGHATAKHTGIRDAVASIAMKGCKSNDARVIVEGLHLAGLSAPSPAEGGFLPNHRNLCTEIVWNEDAQFSTTPSSFDQYHALLSHKYPALSVLQVGGGLSVTLSNLDRMAPMQGETPRLSRYTLVECSSDIGTAALSKVKGTCLEPFVEVKQDWSQLSAEYHFIVVFSNAGVEADSLLKHLKYGGVLLQQNADDDAQAKETLSKSEGFMADQFQNSCLPPTVFRKQHVTTGEPLPPIVLLLPQDFSLEVASFAYGMHRQMQKRYHGQKISTVFSHKVLNESTTLSGKVVISLLDFASTAAKGSSVFHWSETDFAIFHKVQKTAKGIFWVTRAANMRPFNPKGAPIIALARTLMSEDPLKTIITFDLGLGHEPLTSSISETVFSVLEKSFHTNLVSEPREMEYALENGKLYIPRLRPVAPLNRLIEEEDFHQTFVRKPFLHDIGKPRRNLCLSRPGIAEGSWYYTELPERDIGADEVEIAFGEVPLTYWDLETAMGCTTEFTIGMDVKGRVKRVGSNVRAIKPDDEVMALVSSGTVQSAVRANARFTTKRRTGVAPSFYVSAFYAIVYLGRAGPNRKVLIHAGASAYGLAAVQMARSVGADVFATCLGPESDRQRNILLDFGLTEDRIVDAKSDAFIAAARVATGGEGFDMIYNPTREHIEANVQCVRKCGVFVQFASKSPSPMALPPVEGTVMVVNFDLCELMREDEAFVVELFNLATRHIDSPQFSTVLNCPTSCSFPIDKLEDALDQIQMSPYIGYSNLTADADPSTVVPVVCQNSTKTLGDSIDCEGTYIFAGGLGGLGRSISELLVSNGARHIAYISRSGASTTESLNFISSLQTRGINARVYKVDLCNKQALRRIIKDDVSVKMPPIRGVFQCAAVINDAVFDNMTYSNWTRAIQPKTVGSWNLTKAVEAVGQDPFFVFLASSAGVIGSRGQANYAAGNCFEDALARHLRLCGKRAVAIDLGPVLGAGMLAENQEMLDRLRASGFYGIRHRDFLTVVKHAITGETTPGNATPAQVVLGVGTGGIIRQNQPADPYWSRTALYAYLNLVDMPPPDLSSTNGAVPGTDFKTTLACCTSTAAAAEIVQTGLLSMLAKAMNMLPEELDASKPPNAYGVDSLVAVGVRNFVIGRFGVQLSVFEVLSDDTIAELSKTIAEKGGYGANRE
ncbi:hypothetical protein RJ55_01847 [Drechmeria coniospora]|nr:hypothetical protein RJ55_01847 [Drechmeria coniospora]